MEQHSERSQDPLVEETEAERARSAASRLFDIRRVIGGLFVVYGVLVGLVGLFDGQPEIDKAQGLRINLWAGLLMLLFGVAMLAWQWLRPVEPPTVEEAQEV
ncbi:MULTISPECIES: hypothetical protein [unclassified Micromonospora]|uniref:hypothetical protein n=1 Tax=unclassified Micromonospora TaxID=2617518 RepID=UPI00104CF271|nr:MULTISPECIES: hypothetical protein [unclassified Micromonospora]TDB78621.1 hypothetical protein E1182_15515 [Micromonospora sp. KC721]TDC32438.1 hypothetical protein E1166_26775 [Micromonospora sp. KC213]